MGGAASLPANDFASKPPLAQNCLNLPQQPEGTEDTRLTPRTGTPAWITGARGTALPSGVPALADNQNAHVVSSSAFNL